MTGRFKLVALSEMSPGEEADFFALLAAKDESKTRDGRVYFRVTFRDAAREVSFPIWAESPLAADCKDQWQVGAFYKLRATYRETSFGPQLDIQRIRAVTPDDRSDGFDELMCVPRSRTDPAMLFASLFGLVQNEIQHPQIKALVAAILEQNQGALLNLPAATWHHHAYLGGFLEHVLSVTRNAVVLADRYCQEYAHLSPPLSRDLVIAGAVLHDIGKLRELKIGPAGGAYTPQGELIGHIVLGRDILREAAQTVSLDEETLLRLEHIIISHQRTAEWGSPKPPMTPEALLVHYADDVDAKFHMLVAAFDEPASGEMTSNRNPLRQKVFRGLIGP
jgi:3'-5' exoribonuclease